MICCLYSMFIFALILTVIFSSRKGERKRIGKEVGLTILLPLPVVLFLGAWFYNFYSSEDTGDFLSLAILLTLLSLSAGFLVIFHILKDKETSMEPKEGRPIAAAILILAPLLLFFEDAGQQLAALYFIAGFFLGLHGFISYQNGQKSGLAYIYASALFMVVVPILAFAVATIYTELLKDEFIYHRAPDYETWSTCHLPAPFSIPDNITYAGTLGTIYALFGSMFFFWRRGRLERKLAREGVIPKEFADILKSGEKAVLVEEDDLGIPPIRKKEK